MRTRYVTAVIIALASVALITKAVFGRFGGGNIPDAPVLYMFAYAYALLGLWLSGCLAYEARTGHHLNSRALLSMGLIAGGGAGVLFLPELYSPEAEMDYVQVGVLIGGVASFIAFCAGLWLLIAENMTAGTSDNKH